MNRRTFLKRLGLGGTAALIGAKATQAQELSTEPVVNDPIAVVASEPVTPWFASITPARPSSVMYWGYPFIALCNESQELISKASALRTAIADMDETGAPL